VRRGNPCPCGIPGAHPGTPSRPGLPACATFTVPKLIIARSLGPHFLHPAIVYRPFENSKGPGQPSRIWRGGGLGQAPQNGPEYYGGVQQKGVQNGLNSGSELGSDHSRPTRGRGDLGPSDSVGHSAPSNPVSQYPRIITISQVTGISTLTARHESHGCSGGTHPGRSMAVTSGLPRAVPCPLMSPRQGFLGYPVLLPRLGHPSKCNARARTGSDTTPVKAHFYPFSRPPTE